MTSKKSGKQKSQRIKLQQVEISRSKNLSLKLSGKIMKQKKSKLNKTTIKSIVTKIKSKVKNNDKKRMWQYKKSRP